MLAQPAWEEAILIGWKTTVFESTLHVLNVEEQEAIGIIKEERKGTYGLHLLTTVRYAIMVKRLLNGALLLM